VRQLSPANGWLQLQSVAAADSVDIVRGGDDCGGGGGDRSAQLGSTRAFVDKTGLP